MFYCSTHEIVISGAALPFHVGCEIEEVEAAKPTNPKDAIGASKPPSSTVPQTVAAEVGVALLEGACKYGRHNYRAIEALTPMAL